MIKTKKRKGASSVLILFTVIILVTLGFATVISAGLNLNLSLQSSQWNRAYYQLDSSSESVVAEIDDALYSAEQEAVKYVMNSEYLLYSSTSIPNDVHNINKIIYKNDVNNIYDVLNNTYKFLAVEHLKSIEEKYGGEVVVLYNKDGSIYSMYYKNIFKKPDDEHYKLSIKLNIQDILYDVQIENGHFSGRKIDFKSRYLITRWRQSYRK